MSKIIIIGGGIAGLAAAVHLKAGAKAHGKTVEVLLLEKNRRIGGKILTEKHDKYLIEGGPDSFLPGKGLDRESRQVPRPRTRNASLERPFQGHLHLLTRQLHSLPEGVMLMVPTSFKPMAKSKPHFLAGQNAHGHGGIHSEAKAHGG